MKIVIPVEITPSRLIESNVPLDDYPEYDAGATYETGERVIVTGNINKIYELVSQEPTTGVYPPTDNEDPPSWLEVSAVNRWKMFDTVISTRTVGRFPFNSIDYGLADEATLLADFVNQSYMYGGGEAGIAVRIRPDAIADTLAVFNTSALYVDIKCVTLEGVVYQRRINMGGSLSESNWYSYFYQPVERVDRFILTDLPEDAEKDIYLSFVEQGTDDPSVGEVVVGRINEVGASLYGVNLGILDFSRKERNAFGQYDIIERGFADTMEVDMVIDNSDISFVKRFMSQIRAKPAIYIAEDSIEATAVYGYFTDFQIIISGPCKSDATLSIEGLI